MTNQSPSVETAGYPPGGGGPPGGGYPPPGGGGPPGGGYPPPGGGGPPGGGYPPPGGGGPPGGGFGPPGGPPPGGGFGGPPGGPPGGFGGGPPGMGGPPGPPGYGPAPMGPPGAPGFGHGAPPPQKKSNLGLIIGLGCGGLALLGIIITVIAVAVGGSEPDDVDLAADDPETKAPTEKVAPKPTGEGKLELKDLRFYEARGSSKILYVVGELANIGTAPINAPRAKVTVYDSSKTALDSTTCGAFVVHDLQPDEKVPCYSVMSKAAGWKTYKIEPETSKSYVKYKAADLKISDVESTSPRSRFGAHKVTGKITNKSGFTAKSVWVVVGLYDGKGKIVGAGKTLVAGNDLGAGAKGKFTVSIYNVASEPKKSLTKVFGYDK